MRDLVISALLFVAAVGLGCSGPVKTASREVDRVSRFLLVTDTRTQKAVSQALEGIAVEEGRKMGDELRKLGCPSLTSTQPASAPAACVEAGLRGKATYEARAAKVLAAATKAETALKAAWSCLRVVVDVLEDIDAGGKTDGLLAKLAKVLSDIPRLVADAQAAYEAIRGTP